MQDKVPDPMISTLIVQCTCSQLVVKYRYSTCTLHWWFFWVHKHYISLGERKRVLQVMLYKEAYITLSNSPLAINPACVQFKERVCY